MSTGRRAFLRSAVSLAATGPWLCRAREGGVCSGNAVGEPVLEAPSEDSVGVAWAVSRLATGSVEVADNPAMANARSFKSGEMPLACLDDQSLTVRVTGLKPATRYWYRTITQDIVSEHNRAASRIHAGERTVGSVRSFVTPGAAAESRFAVMNDTHAAWDSFAYTSAALKRGRFPVVVWNGDALNCTDDKAVAVRAFLDPQVPTRDYAAETPVLWTNGNHDYEGTWARRLEEVMLARPAAEHEGEFAALKWNFAVRQGEIALIGLDTGEGLHDDDLRLVGLGSFSPYRRLQARWLAAALKRPKIASAPFVVAFCHIPLWNTGDNPNGCEEPRTKGCASWIRECYEAWGPVLDAHKVQLVVCGHEHSHRWDEDIPRFSWQQVLGGGPELSIPQWGEKGNRYYPTLIEGEARDGELVVSVRDTWRDRIVSTRAFKPRQPLPCRLAQR